MEGLIEVSELRLGAGYKSRFVYCTTLNYGETVGFPGLNKFDMSLPEGQQVVATIDHEGPHRFGELPPLSPLQLHGASKGLLGKEGQHMTQWGCAADASWTSQPACCHEW